MSRILNCYSDVLAIDEDFKNSLFENVRGSFKRTFQTYIETYFPSLDNKIADVKLIDEPLTNYCTS